MSIYSSHDDAQFFTDATHVVGAADASQPPLAAHAFDVLKRSVYSQSLVTFWMAAMGSTCNTLGSHSNTKVTCRSYWAPVVGLNVHQNGSESLAAAPWWCACTPPVDGLDGSTSDHSGGP